MSKKVYIGKVVSAHGIKGEIKIISDFEIDVSNKKLVLNK